MKGRLVLFWFLIAALVALLLSSCSAEKLLQRAIAKDPSILNDSIVRIDTMIVTKEKTIKETVLKRDTIEIEKDRVRVKIVTVLDSVEVEAYCPPDTVTVFKEVKVPQYIAPEKKKETFGDKIKSFLSFIGVLALIVVIVRFILLRK